MSPYTDKKKLSDLFDRSTESLTLPADYTAVLEGSIAEGFGNDSSDYDFLVVDLDRRSVHREIPSIFFVEGKRVEIRFRSITQVEGYFEQLSDYAQRDAYLEIPDTLIDERCQRFLNSLPLRNEAALRSIRTGFTKESLRKTIENWFRAQAMSAVDRVLLMKLLNLDVEAVTWARKLLNLSAKTFAAMNGETYGPPKWISLQLQRLNNREVLEEFCRLDSPARAKLPWQDYLAASLKFARHANIETSQVDEARFRFKKKIGVTSWRIGETVHVVDGTGNIYAMGPRAAITWSQVAFQAPIKDLLERMTQKTAGSHIGTFYRLGFLDIDDGESSTLTHEPSGLTPIASHPCIGLTGRLLTPAEDDAVCLLPVTAQRFANCGIALAWSNMVAENALEDARGAIAQEQWGTAESSIRRILRLSAQALLSANLVHPLPPPEEACYRLSDLPGYDEVAQLCEHTDRNLCVTNAKEAKDTLSGVLSIVDRMRSVAGSALYPSSFDSSEQWRQTVEIGYDWARLGSYVGSEFPCAEVRELVAASVN